MTIRHMAALTGSIALLLAGCSAGGDSTGDEDAAAATQTEAPASTDDEAEESEPSEESEQPGETSDGNQVGDEVGDDDGDAATAADDVDRVVRIDMEDIAFSEEELEFSVGERVRFEFENVGDAPHEALIGDMHVQEEHEQQMAEGDDEGHEDEDDGHEGELSTISLESGESGSFVHEFTEAGELWMGCHVPGHWDAGMRTRITVDG